MTSTVSRSESESLQKVTKRVSISDFDDIQKYIDSVESLERQLLLLKMKHCIKGLMPQATHASIRSLHSRFHFEPDQSKAFWE